MKHEPVLFDLFPPRARACDPDTSKAAAASIPRVSTAHACLLTAYMRAGELGLTDEQAAIEAELDMRSCWWKRCSELRAVGLVVPTGEERISSSGRRRIVCRAVRQASGRVHATPEAQDARQGSTASRPSQPS